MFMVRIVFEWMGELVHDYVGPFDRYFADLVCVGYATEPYVFGITPVRVLRARVEAADAFRPQGLLA